MLPLMKFVDINADVLSDFCGKNYEKYSKKTAKKFEGRPAVVKNKICCTTATNSPKPNLTDSSDNM